MIDPLQASLTVSSSGLQAQSQRVLVATENLANLNSTGKTPGADPYTRKLITFEPDFDRELGASKVKAGEITLDRTPYPVQKDPGNPAADAAGYVQVPNVDMLSRWPTSARPTGPIRPICKWSNRRVTCIAIDHRSVEEADGCIPRFDLGESPAAGGARRGGYGASSLSTRRRRGAGIVGPTPRISAKCWRN